MIRSSNGYSCSNRSTSLFFTLRFKRWILAILILISFTSALRIAPPSQSSLTRPSSLSGKPVSRVDQSSSVQTDIDEAIAHFTFRFRFLFTIDANARLHHILVFLVATRKRMETWIAGSEGQFLLAINNQERRKVDGAWLARRLVTKKPSSRSRSKTIYQGQYESINHVVVGGRRIHENKQIILLISRIFSNCHFAGNTAREINKNTVLNRLLENIPSTLHISQITKNGCCQWRTKKKIWETQFTQPLSNAEIKFHYLRIFKKTRIRKNT